jgi:hypothetical protein
MRSIWSYRLIAWGHVKPIIWSGCISLTQDFWVIPDFRIYLSPARIFTSFLQHPKGELYSSKEKNGGSRWSHTGQTEEIIHFYPKWRPMKKVNRWLLVFLNCGIINITDNAAVNWNAPILSYSQTKSRFSLGNLVSKIFSFINEVHVPNDMSIFINEIHGLDWIFAWQKKFIVRLDSR